MRRFLNVLGFSTVALMLAAFRCPGPTPEGGPDRPVGGGGFGADPGTGGDGQGGERNCDPERDEDHDGDGYSIDDGDCDDCDPLVHPGAAELPTEGDDPIIDENCNGQKDEVMRCEPNGNATDLMSAELAARAMEICEAGVVEDRDWGYLSVRFVNADGSQRPDNNENQVRQASLANQFGQHLFPEVGDRMLVLSSGNAQDGDLPTFCSPAGCGNGGAGRPAQPGETFTMVGCPEPTTIHDEIALEVELLPPPNAAGFLFHAAYLTKEYPHAICTPFTDQFLARQIPKPDGWATDNLVYDEHFMPPSVSFTPFKHCDPTKKMEWALSCEPTQTMCPLPPAVYCPEGKTLLDGTGFEHNEFGGGATTGWMTTVVPLTTDGNITLRFAIFDTNNPDLDSTVLLDGFTWLGPTELPPFPETHVR